jgi:hypothetical protein
VAKWEAQQTAEGTVVVPEMKLIKTVNTTVLFSAIVAIAYDLAQT